MPSGPAEAYGALAGVYDRWQNLHGPDYTAIILPRLLGSLARHGPPARIHVDAACGTGTLVLALARRGWCSTGFDISPAMVAAASSKPAPGGTPVVFHVMDMRAFSVATPAGVVTAMFDSVNHLLTLRDLGRFFTCAARALLPGGLLIFDTNNERCYRKLWTGMLQERGDGFSMDLRNAYVPSRRRARSTVVVREEGHPRAVVHTGMVEERCYTRREILGPLRAAGFTPLEVREFGFSHAPEFGHLKTWWVARKAR